MLIWTQQEDWVRCSACSGTGARVPPVPSNELISAMVSTRRWTVELRKTTQGICAACDGRGQHRVIRRSNPRQVSLLHWLWNQLFKW
jgi:hypothetical protein